MIGLDYVHVDSCACVEFVTLLKIYEDITNVVKIPVSNSIPSIVSPGKVDKHATMLTLFFFKLSNFK